MGGRGGCEKGDARMLRRAHQQVAPSLPVLFLAPPAPAPGGCANLCKRDTKGEYTPCVLPLVILVTAPPHDLPKLWERIYSLGTKNQSPASSSRLEGCLSKTKESEKAYFSGPPLIDALPCSRRTRTLWSVTKRGPLFCWRLRAAKRFRMRGGVERSAR